MKTKLFALQRNIEWSIPSSTILKGCFYIFQFRGLGTEVCRRSEELAAELGCTYTYVAATGEQLTMTYSLPDKSCFIGLYSQRVFEKLGHTVINRVMYEEFRDENGELNLKDTREHTSIIHRSIFLRIPIPPLWKHFENFGKLFEQDQKVYRCDVCMPNDFEAY